MVIVEIVSMGSKVILKWTWSMRLLKESESKNSCYKDKALCFSLFFLRVILSEGPSFVYHQTPLFFSLSTLFHKDILQSLPFPFLTTLNNGRSASGQYGAESGISVGGSNFTQGWDKSYCSTRSSFSVLFLFSWQLRSA